MRRVTLFVALSLAFNAWAKPPADRTKPEVPPDHKALVELAKKSWTGPAGPSFQIYYVPRENNLILDEDLYWPGWESYLQEGSKERTEHQGTTHATSWAYDQRVPLLFHGGEYFKKGHRKSEASPVDIAPTIAKLMGIDLEKADGHVRTEILKDHPGRPSVVLLVVIDQMGVNYHHQHAKRMPYLQRLIDEGAYFDNARLDYAQSMTAVSHAVIGTGSYPHNTGIFENKLYYATVKKEEDVYYDPNSKDGVDVAQLRVRALIDLWGEKSGNQARNLAYCMENRAAIGLGGHGAFERKLDPKDRPWVFWFDKKSRRMTTDTRWFGMPDRLEPLPTKWEEFPKQHENSQSWNGQLCMKNGEIEKKCWLGSPHFVAYEGEQLRRAIKARGVGQSGVTDIVAINLKSGDYCGHYLGPESGECGDTLAAIDHQVEAIHKDLQGIAHARLATVVTADHGVAPLSRGKVIEDKQLKARIDQEFGTGVVLHIGASSAQLDLSKAKNSKTTLKDVRDYLVNRYKGGSFFYDVVTQDEIEQASQ